jgi:hypothetical protein
MARLERMLTFQLRPHVAAMLDAYVHRVQSRAPSIRVTQSLVLRKLLERQLTRAESLDWIGNRRFRDGRAVHIRARVPTTTRAASAREIGALILEAMHPDGNYPVNPDSQPQPLKNTP